MQEVEAVIRNKRDFFKSDMGVGNLSHQVARTSFSAVFKLSQSH